ncbi:MAG: HAMP domain-containing protein [Deltaproteobacteria bacterium]|jgi:methyl-accepting chemotaxis protein|nr:HAMP domain-containing protein [Deltaproteobacteria bacterium]MBT4644646.1 HAMP domain-containing protein [Deltaproteobacteria bacterium]
MLKNMNLAPRLILIGGLLILIPLIIVGSIAVTKAGNSLEASVNNQLASRSRGIAKLVDNILEEQLKFVTKVAIMPDTVRAAEKVYSKGIDASVGELKMLTDHFVKIKQTKGLGDNIQVVGLVGINGTLVAGSDQKYIGANIGERKYFQSAKAGKTKVGEAALNKVTGRPFTSFAAPVYSANGTIVGVSICVFDIGFLSDLIADETIGDTGYASIIDQTGLVIAHPNPDLIMKTNMSRLKGMEALIGPMLAGETGVEHYVFGGIEKTGGYAPIKATGWSVAMTMPDSEYLAPVSQLKTYIFIAAIVAIAAALVVFFLFALSLARNLKKGVEFARRIAQGELNTTIDIDQKDEIGVLANGLKNMSDELRTAISDINSVMNSVKDGDFSRSVTANLSGDFSQLKESINDSIAMLSHTIIQVATNSEQVNIGSVELSTSAQSLATGTTEQAATLEEIASSMGEIEAKTKDNDDNATQSQQLIRSTLEVVESGNKQMTLMLKSINTMKETSEDVTKIIKVIDEIAFQTNLLALNAAVEAARAGKYGKGFAVVAEEVRNLAARSAEAAKNTTDLVTSSVKETENGVLNAEKTSEALTAINESIVKVNDIIEEIAASSKEQKTGIEEINRGLTQVNEVIQSNSSISEETASASDELSAQATNLEQLMGRFKLGKKKRINGTPEQEVPQIESIPVSNLLHQKTITLDDADFGKY